MPDIANPVNLDSLTGASLRRVSQLVTGTDPGPQKGDEAKAQISLLKKTLSSEGLGIAFMTNGKMDKVPEADLEKFVEEQEAAEKAAEAAAPAKAPKEKKAKAPKEPKAPRERAPAPPRGKPANMPTLTPLLGIKVVKEPTIRPGSDGKISNTQVLFNLLKESRTYEEFGNKVKSTEQVAHYQPSGFIQWAVNREAVELTPASAEEIAAFEAAKKEAASARAKAAASAKKAAKSAEPAQATA